MMTPTSSHDAATVLVIGAGPAGLATSRELSVRGVDHLVLERGDRIGHVWANLYDGLVLHTGKHLSALPGMAFPASAPLFPTRRDFLDYLHRYAESFQTPVQTNTEVAGVERAHDGWVVRTRQRSAASWTRGADLRSRIVVLATGIVSNPHVPAIPTHDRFRGRIIHSVAYRRPGAFVGHRVLVVGAGNSAAEISVELARAGAHVTIAVRSGARVVPRELFGIPIQYFAVALAALPRPMNRLVNELVTSLSARSRGPAVLPRAASRQCSNVPLIGFHLIDAIRAATIRLKGGVSEFTADAVRFDDGSEEAFDHVILATGYRAAVRALGDLIRTDDCGFATRHTRVVSRDQPDLYFVGHNYDTRGGLRNIAQDARLAAKLVARSLSPIPNR